MQSYSSAAGAQGAVRRNNTSSSFEDQFPALEATAPHMKNEWKTEKTGKGQKGHSQQTKSEAQAILNAVKRSSAAGAAHRGFSSTSEQASGILSGLSGGNNNKSNLPPGLVGNDRANNGKERQETPESAVPMDRYGLKGLLPLLRNEPSEQATIAMGVDLNMLGLSLSAKRDEPSGKLCENFASPWLETSRSEVEPLFNSPDSFKIPEKDLKNVEDRIGSFDDETLFFIFYSKPRDTLQELAARELNRRDWRYHKDLQVWLTKSPTSQPVPNGPGAERGTYIFFDPTSWEYVTKGFVLSYESII